MIKKTEIPEFVQELMKRSAYEFEFHEPNNNRGLGYTIRIYKQDAEVNVENLKEEVDALCWWANAVNGKGTAYIKYMPTATYCCDQYALVVIYDPMMQRLDKYIPGWGE